MISISFNKSVNIQDEQRPFINMQVYKHDSLKQKVIHQ